MKIRIKKIPNRFDYAGTMNRTPKDHSFGGNLFDTGGDTENNGVAYIHTDEEGKYYVNSTNNGRIYVTPTDTSHHNPAKWTYKDEYGREYTPHDFSENREVEQTDPDQKLRGIEDITPPAYHTPWSVEMSDWTMQKASNSHYSSDRRSPMYHGGLPQRTFLANRKDQREALLNSGLYIEGTPGDYGLVTKAVGDRDIPVYQRAKDAIDRKDLVVVGNINNGYYGPRETELIHPGQYPTALYVDPTTINKEIDWENGKSSTPKFYQKAWDLNDYGGAGGSTAGLAGLIADAVGNPIVQTTGFQKTTTDNDEKFMKALDTSMKEKGLVKHYIRDPKEMEEALTDIEGNPVYINGIPMMKYNPLYHKSNYYYGLPEVPVIGHKKAGGGNLFKGGGDTVLDVVYDKAENQFYLKGDETPLLVVNHGLGNPDNTDYLNWTFMTSDGRLVTPYRNTKTPVIENGDALVLERADLEYAKKKLDEESIIPINTLIDKYDKSIDILSLYIPGLGIGAGIADLTYGEINKAYPRVMNNIFPTVSTLVPTSRVITPTVGTGLATLMGTHAASDMLANGVNTKNTAEGAFAGLGLAPDVMRSIVIPAVAKTDLGKRAAEVLMRTSSNGDPTRALTWALQDMTFPKAKAITKYIATGKGTDGIIYDSLGNGRYQGLRLANDIEGNLKPLEGTDDYIGAYLYGNTIDPRIAKKVDTTDYGVHENYVGENYGFPREPLPVYETAPYNDKGSISHNQLNLLLEDPNTKATWLTTDSEGNVVESSSPVTFSNDGPFLTSIEELPIDTQGHLGSTVLITNDKLGLDKIPYTYYLDIWKFNPKDYSKKYGLLGSLLKELGLEFIDLVGNPIITRTPVFVDKNPFCFSIELGILL